VGSLDTQCCRAYSHIMEMKLELVMIPVADVDRAKAFYVEKIGFHADFDQVVSDQIRFVQLTPPGSACSIAFGKGISEMQPGTLKGLLMVVKDVQAARDELLARGVAVSEVDDQPWALFVYFSDPDGNTWSLQQPHRASENIQATAPERVKKSRSRSKK
jgi:catechol 2,3-dioxygenase-like lactoylglutathione lyase family enzyme